MKNYKKLLVRYDCSVKDALSIIDKGAKKISVVVKEDATFAGTLSDGDVRRGLLNGIGLEDSIDSIVFIDSLVMRPGDNLEQVLHLASERNVQYIPILDENDKVIGIEKIDSLKASRHYDNVVVLMAGGLGTRLRPLTENTPKPMLKVGDKPILQTIIENFARYGFTHIIISVNYLADQIMEFFGDGTAFGVTIEYVKEEKRLGTAGALDLMRDRLQKPFFVMNGDLLTNMNFESMLQKHLDQNAVATMGVREYDFQVPYGVVNVNNGQISSIEEKPIHTFFVSAGIYLLSPEALEDVPSDEFFDMPTLFDTLIKENKSTVPFSIRGYWMDIGRLSDYERANDEYSGVFN